MSDSIRLCCVLYTLEGKNVKENKYVDIFLIWLSYVSKYAEMRPIDCIQITTDHRTHNELIAHNATWNTIVKSLHCEVQFQVVSPPKTHAEGMMNKYKYKSYPQELYMYCDIDILFKQPIYILLNDLKNNTLVLHSEGILSDPNYGAAFTKCSIDETQNHNGFSAGKFVIYGQELCKTLFERVNLLASKHPIDTYYCVEQPIFNLAVYQLCNENVCEINYEIISAPMILTNVRDSITTQTVLIDYMGQPGNDTFHFSKLFHVLIEHFLYSS